MYISKYKATGLLVICIFLAVFTYPYRQDPWLGFLYHGMLAAAIGGLADWYAVTALFRRPLGISWRTELIVRNRERIFDAIHAYVCYDLLNVERLQQAIKEIPVVKLLLEYLEASRGKEKIDGLLCRWTDLFLKCLKMQPWTPWIEDFLREAQVDKQIQQSTKLLFARLKDGRKAEPFIESFLLQLEAFLREPVVMRELESLVAEVKEQYAVSFLQRQVALQAFDVSAEKLTKAILEACMEEVQKLRDPSNPFRGKIESKIFLYIEQWIEENPLFETGFLAEKIERWVRQWIEDLQQQLPARVPDWTGRYLERLHAETDLAAVAETGIKRFMNAWIVQNHFRIEEIVKERLTLFSDRELAAFVEEKVKDDLQMIRINGSLVGAIAGMLLYAATKFAGI